MYEINLETLETDSKDFSLARRAVLDRYDRLFAEHTPHGRLIRGRDAPQRGVRCEFIHCNRHESHADHSRRFQL